VRRLLLLVAALPLLAACGRSEGAAIVARAQDGLRRLDDSPVQVRVSVETPVRIRRHFELRASELPLQKIELTRWTRHVHRIACARDLDCARADVDVEAVLAAFRPLLPELPVDPHKIRSAQVDLAVEKSGRLAYLHVHGDLQAALLLEVPFEADLDVRH